MTPAHRIILAAADATGCSLAVMRSASRLSIAAEARGVAAALLRERLGMRHEAIAMLLERERTTIVVALRHIDAAVAAVAAGERVTGTMRRRVDALVRARADLDTHRPSIPQTIASMREVGRECLDVAARMELRELDGVEPALVAIALDGCTRALAAMTLIESRLDKRERGEAQRTSPERHHSPGAHTSAE